MEESVQGVEQSVRGATKRKKLIIVEQGGRDGNKLQQNETS